VSLLYEGRHYFWIGIYLVIGETAVRQAFCGPVPPCHSFALGKGNVGTTGQRGITKVVPDVNQDPTYSMCFRDTKSEIVVPIKIATRVLGVIDVESDQANAFGREERVLLEEVAGLLARFLVADGKYIMRQAREQWLRESSTKKAAQKVRAPEARAAAESR
jgi:GAF domain-containing protein